jgi:cysteinyl-tRNA synthetase
MPLRLDSTLSRQLDDLVLMDGSALSMCACGPTVYDYGRIGNFRTFLEMSLSIGSRLAPGRRSSL